MDVSQEECPEKKETNGDLKDTCEQPNSTHIVLLESSPDSPLKEMDPIDLARNFHANSKNIEANCHDLPPMPDFPNYTWRTFSTWEDPMNQKLPEGSIPLPLFPGEIGDGTIVQCCLICNDFERKGSTVLCDGCGYAHHLNCLPKKLTSRDFQENRNETWLCKFCQNEAKNLPFFVEPVRAKLQVQHQEIEKIMPSQQSMEKSTEHSGHIQQPNMASTQPKSPVVPADQTLKTPTNPLRLYQHPGLQAATGQSLGFGAWEWAQWGTGHGEIRAEIPPIFDEEDKPQGVNEGKKEVFLANKLWVGPNHQAQVEEWKGKPIRIRERAKGLPGSEEPLSLEEIEDMENTRRLRNNNLTLWVPAREIPIDSPQKWVSCTKVLYKKGEIMPGGNVALQDVPCGKYRRVPIMANVTNYWECFDAIFWDPLHADCAVPQELSNEEIHQRRDNRKNKLENSWAEDKKFYSKLEELFAWKEEKGHCQIPPSNALGKWLWQMREANQNGSLDWEYKEILEDFGVILDPEAAIWEENFQALLSYKKKKGNIFLKEGGKGIENLKTWLDEQSQLYELAQVNAVYLKRLQRLQDLGFP